MTRGGAYLTANEHVNYVGMGFGEKTYGLESSEPISCIDELGIVFIEDSSSIPPAIPVGGIAASRCFGDDSVGDDGLCCSF